MALPEAQHPGPQPRSFEFPFAELDRAIAEIDELIASLATCTATHEHAAHEARADWQGITRRSFDLRLGQHLDALGGLATSLRNQHAEMEELRVAARRAEQISAAAVEDWSRRVRSYEAARERATAR